MKNGVDSEMAGPSGLKLGGMIKGIWENVLDRDMGGMIHDSLRLLRKRLRLKIYDQLFMTHYSISLKNY